MNRRDALVKFVVDEFLLGDQTSDLPDDLDLIANSVIDSLGLLKIIAFLEDHYGVSIAPEAMVPETFRSIGSMMAVISQQLDGARPGTGPCATGS
jgi:acyl carrier protein